MGPRFRSSCVWFSAMLSRESSVAPVRARLAELGARRRRFELTQGSVTRWVVAWTFLAPSEREAYLLAAGAATSPNASSPGLHKEPLEERPSSAHDAVASEMPTRATES